MSVISEDELPFDMWDEPEDDMSLGARVFRCACPGLMSAYSCLRSREDVDEGDLTADDGCDCPCHED